MTVKLKKFDIILIYRNELKYSTINVIDERSIIGISTFGHAMDKTWIKTSIEQDRFIINISLLCIVRDLACHIETDDIVNKSGL